ncbi:hypothetical protein A1D31_10995 [Bradyrhizobium liaoningense]|nr:hypothetical protein A1D31_10995 [Bradyrhizobium liaoningense]
MAGVCADFAETSSCPVIVNCNLRPRRNKFDLRLTNQGRIAMKCNIGKNGELIECRLNQRIGSTLKVGAMRSQFGIDAHDLVGSTKLRVYRKRDQQADKISLVQFRRATGTTSRQDPSFR